MKTVCVVVLAVCTILVEPVASQTNKSPSNAKTYSGTSIDAAVLFEKGMNALSGVGLSRNPNEAIKYIRSSAELGYAPAQVVLGYFFDTEAVRFPGDAAHWYRKAAEQGDLLAQWLLGRLLATGDGVPRDLAAAQRWLLPPAEAGDPFAGYLLGLVMEDRDYTQAVKWHRGAAEQGLPQAQERLGRLLREGRGVKQDKYEAYVWLLLSFETGNQSLAPELALLEGDLGSTLLDKAKEEVRRKQSIVSRSVVAGGCTGWEGEFDRIPAPPPPKLQRFCR